MIKFTDFTYSDERFYMIAYVSDLLSYVQFSLDRHIDVPKTIEYYKYLSHINEYLNSY